MRESIRAAYLLGWAISACGSRTGLDSLEPASNPLPSETPPEAPGESRDAAVPQREAGAMEVAGRDGGADRPCDPRTTNPETSPIADVFGGVVRFGAGADLPRGHYRVEYVDGCMKYSGNQDWSIHAYRDGSDGWWLVGATTSDRIAMPPGTVGFLAGGGGFTTFDACIAANKKLGPVELDFGGGKLGVWLQDDPYGDNVAGENGRSPEWRIVFSGVCPF